MNDGSSYTRYVLKDHLGSIETITDELGNVVEALSYDAWGNRRNAEDWTPASELIEGEHIDRGFTGHEHLDRVGLIHMNGRIYDPIVGRFLNVDIAVQAPENLQNFNRYSYVLNNPLSYTDPSGYFISLIIGAALAIAAGAGVSAAISATTVTIL